MNARNRSIIAQLENDQLLETQGDAIERAYRRGHNTATLVTAARLRQGFALILDFVRETHPDNTELERAANRGYNAGIRHVRHVLRVNAGLAELAHAPVIRTINWPFDVVEVEVGGEGG